MPCLGAGAPQITVTQAHGAAPMDADKCEVAGAPTGAAKEYAYYTKCCRKGLIPAGAVVPEEKLTQVIGSTLDLPDGEGIMCLQV